MSTLTAVTKDLTKPKLKIQSGKTLKNSSKSKKELMWTTCEQNVR